MAAETISAASSPAEVEDVFQGRQPSFSEYSHYRETGELPGVSKPAEEAESATAGAPEESAAAPEGDEPEIAPDSDPEDTQEPPQKGSGAEKRIKQLLAEKKELQRKLEAAAKPDASPASSPEPAAPQQPQHTRPKPTVEDKKPDGTPKFGSYDEFVEDLADWKAEQRIAANQRQQAEQAALKTLQTKLDDARTRYDDADDVIFPAAQTIREARIPGAVRQVFEDSDLFIDLCYVVGGDEKELKGFVSLAQSNPRAAIAKVFEYERGIREELVKAGKQAAEPEGGAAPEPRKTAAPKPPSPVGGGGSRAFDVSDESLSPDEWARKRTADLKKRGKA